MTCTRVKEKFDKCGHEIQRYKFCGGSHTDSHEERQNCHNTKRNPLPTTEKAPNRPRKCPDCLANEAGWDCHKCGAVVGPGNTTSCGTDGCSHEFCFDCETGEN